jgi:uncharacterized protein (TIGR02270 family)
MNFQPLAISGVGLVTSVGHDAETSVCSLRSDVTRMQEVSQTSRQGYPLVGAPIVGCGDSLLYAARLWGLASIAADEAFQRAELVGARLCRNRCCVLWILPDNNRHGFNAAVKGERRRKFAEAHGLTEEDVMWLGISCGHAAAIVALREASRILESGRADACLIGGADTLIQLRVLRWLEASDRLKTETYTDGLIPGEAAAFLVVESKQTVSARKGPILAWIKGYGIAKEDASILSSKPCRGQGLTEALRTALQSARLGVEDLRSILCDLNGESYRAKEWGLAAVRMAFPDTVRLLHPADCIGDVGAVTGVVLLAHGAMILAQPKLSDETILTFACSESGERGAAVLVHSDQDVHSRELLVQAKLTKRPEELESAKKEFLKGILEDHFEEAVFLWHQRELAFRSPAYNVQEIAALEQRLEAHLDGLRFAGIRAWEIWKQYLTWKEPGEAFAAAALAFYAGIAERIQEVFECGIRPQQLSVGLVSALAWFPYDQAQTYIKKLLSYSTAEFRRIGIAASAIHRRDPGQALREGMFSDDDQLRARAFRAVGELGRLELARWLLGALADPDERVRFDAAWSVTLLSVNLDSVAVLRTLAESSSPYREEALQTAIRRMDLTTAKSWQVSLSQRQQTLRTAIVAFGAIGDPDRIPWLLEQMNLPAMARVAGEAFTMITGVDLAYNNLGKSAPEEFEAEPIENPDDENMGMHPDENLPWPDPATIQKWWTKNQSQFQNGTRYLLGKPMSIEWLRQILRMGRQRQRAAAALELAIRQPGQPLFEVRAPGFRQQTLLKTGNG